MPCCFYDNFDKKVLEIEYNILNSKIEKIIEKLYKLEMIINKLQNDNNILLNEYDRLKIEYDTFFKTYYDETNKEKI